MVSYMASWCSSESSPFSSGVISRATLHWQISEVLCSDGFLLIYSWHSLRTDNNCLVSKSAAAL